MYVCHISIHYEQDRQTNLRNCFLSKYTVCSGFIFVGQDFRSRHNSNRAKKRIQILWNRLRSL